MTDTAPKEARAPAAGEGREADETARGEGAAVATTTTGAPNATEPETEPATGSHTEQDAPEDKPQAPQGGGGPAMPPFTPMPPFRAAGYFLTAAFLALSQGFGQSVVSVNAQQLQGAFGATQYETMWLVAAYMAPNVSLTLALIKIRAQYGLRNFAEWSILLFLLATLLNYLAGDLFSNVAVRFVSGMAAAPMTSLAFLYALEPLSPQKKMNIGLSFALTMIFIAAPLTRLISPYLLSLGLWHALTAVEASMAAISLGLIFCFPLASPPHMKVIHPADVISFIFIFIGFGCLAVCFTLGASYWWLEQNWIGWTLVVGVASLTVSVVMELNRKSPLVDVRWILSPAIVHFAGALLLFRLVLSEQTSGIAGLFRVLSIPNEAMMTLWAIILGATLLGGLICAILLKPGRDRYFHVVALVLIIIGALLDSRVTSDFVPEQFYLSQALIGLAAALFLPPAMLSGLIAALTKGRQYILSFIIVFLVTQKVGALLGSAVFQTFVKIRAQLHLQHLYEALPKTDPVVTLNLRQLMSLYSSTISDSSQLSTQAAKQLATQASVQANVMAYADAFVMTAVMAGVALILLLGHMALDAWRARQARNAAAETTPQPA